MEEKDIMEQGLEEVLSEEEAPQVEELGKTLIEPEKDKAATGTEPPKKKWTKGKIALICVIGFILLVGIAFGVVVLVGTLLKQDIKVVKGEFHNTPPAVAVTYSESELNLIKSAMKDNASDAVVKDAIAMIYNKANQNKISCDQAITILQGQGWADAFGAVGSMAVRGFKVQAGTEFYYQKAAPIVECDPEFLQAMLSDMLVQQERVYSNGVDDFRLTGTLKGDYAKIYLDEKHPMTKTLEFVPVGVPQKSLIKSKDTYEEFMEAGYYLEDPREITNFKITADTIVLNKLEEGQKRIEELETEDGDRYYVCRFSLLISGDNRDECVHYAREYLRASAKSDDLEYKQFDVTLEIWANGYFKMMHDEEKWEGTASGANTSSRSWYESITYYNFSTEYLTEEDAVKYEGEDWARKIIAHYKEELDNAPKK